MHSEALKMLQSLAAGPGCPKFPESEKVTPVPKNSPTQPMFGSDSARKGTLGERWTILQ